MAALGLQVAAGGTPATQPTPLDRELLQSAMEIQRGDSAPEVAAKIERFWQIVPSSPYHLQHPFNEWLPYTNSALISEWRSAGTNSSGWPSLIFAVFNSPEKTNLTDALLCDGQPPQPLVNGPYNRALHAIKAGDPIERLFKVVGQRQLEHYTNKAGNRVGLALYPDLHSEIIRVEFDLDRGLVSRVSGGSGVTNCSEENLFRHASQIARGDPASDVATELEPAWAVVTGSPYHLQHPFNEWLPYTNSALISEWRSAGTNSSGWPSLIFAVFSSHEKTNLTDALLCDGQPPQPLVNGPYNRALHAIKAGDSIAQVYKTVGRRSCKYFATKDGKWSVQIDYFDSRGAIVSVLADAGTGVVNRVKSVGLDR
jgi:hypothetical protein